MRRNFLYNILLATSLVGMTACSDYVDNETYTVGKADNEIHFATGVVSESASRAASHAVYNTESYEFLPLAQGTKLHIKTEGTWAGKANDGAVTHYTQTGTAGTPGTDKSPITGVGIYWDDYGIADPENSTNRAAGINVYAACIDGKDASAIGTISDWTSLSWTTKPGDSQSWQDKDLLFSNNNSDEGKTNSTNMNKNNVGRYKFATQKGRTDCNLELHHAMSKITINLKAGKGFTDAKFVSDPTVTLQSVKLNGSVNIKALTATASGETTTAAIAKSSTTTENYTATYEGLVFPGNELAESQKAAAKSGGFAKINCDGNIYNIYADELMAAMKTAENNTEDYVFHSGKNYILNIIVDKTEIKVTATVTDWVNVNAEEETPLININDIYGHTGTEFANGFSFYMKEASATSFTKGTDVEYHADAVAPARKYSLTTPLYWPNHNTHYNFRGIYPIVGDGGTPTSKVTATAVSVANAAYSSCTFPSDLMIGYPRTENDAAADETCKPHNKAGICATEGDIRMNFLYAMSQVEVILKSELEAGMPEAAKVTLNGNTGIDILNGYTSGSIALMTGVATCTGDKATWPMAGGVYNSETKQYDVNNAVVPQSLTGLKFRVKVDGGNDTFDYYEATIADILVGGSKITEWKPGKKYVYTLNITKTGIKVTATLKDWETVTSDENHIWM